MWTGNTSTPPFRIYLAEIRQEGRGVERRKSTQTQEPNLITASILLGKVAIWHHCFPTFFSAFYCLPFSVASTPKWIICSRALETSCDMSWLNMIFYLINLFSISKYQNNLLYIYIYIKSKLLYSLIKTFQWIRVTQSYVSTYFFHIFLWNTKKILFWFFNILICGSS